MVRVIRKQLVKRTLDMLKELSERASNAEGKSDYATLWEAFGRNIKLGCIEDPGSRDLLAPLLRFPSSKSGEEVTGLGDYISRSAYLCMQFSRWTGPNTPTSTLHLTETVSLVRTSLAMATSSAGAPSVFNIKVILYTLTTRRASHGFPAACPHAEGGSAGPPAEHAGNHALYHSSNGVRV